jgi:hypothetical protein
VLACTRCDWTTNAWASTSFHRHGHKNVALVPRVLRLTSPQLQPALVEDAIAWLDERWQGGVFIPDDLLGVLAAS